MAALSVVVSAPVPVVVVVGSGHVPLIAHLPSEH